MEIRLSQNISALELNVRSDLVAVKGRITDAQSQPVAGAKVRGEHYPLPDSSDVERAYPARFAVSDTDGSYELKGLVPLDIIRLAAYLAGGDPTESGLNPFYVNVYVETNGFVQEKANVPRAPIVTEKLIGPSRRYMKVLNKIQTQSTGSSKIVEKKYISLPSSHGNTITDIDIVLKKAGEGGR